MKRLAKPSAMVAACALLAAPDDEFLVIYGPNHIATGKATYVNVNVFASRTEMLSDRVIKFSPPSSEI